METFEILVKTMKSCEDNNEDLGKSTQINEKTINTTEALKNTRILGHRWR
jgi:hypothetical protein